MHEMSLINDLRHKIEEIAKKHEAPRVTAVKVRLGALSHISPDHFTEHFVEGVRGTAAQGARLDIDVSDDLHDPHAQDILLISVDVAS